MVREIVNFLVEIMIQLLRMVKVRIKKKIKLKRIRRLTLTILGRLDCYCWRGKLWRTSMGSEKLIRWSKLLRVINISRRNTKVLWEESRGEEKNSRDLNETRKTFSSEESRRIGRNTMKLEEETSSVAGDT